MDYANVLVWKYDIVLLYSACASSRRSWGWVCFRNRVQINREQLFVPSYVFMRKLERWVESEPELSRQTEDAQCCYSFYENIDLQTAHVFLFPDEKWEKPFPHLISWQLHADPSEIQMCWLCLHSCWGGRKPNTPCAPVCDSVRVQLHM